MTALRSQKGMTLSELLVASTFAILLTAAVFAFTSFFNYAQYEYQSNVELTNDARQIVEKMVWGHKLAASANRRGIAEAKDGTIVSPTQFEYTDRDDTKHTLRLSNGNIEYQRGAGGAWTTLLDPNGAAAYDATKYTTSVVFSQPTNPNSVQVKVIVGKYINNGKNIVNPGRWYYGTASTQVFYRNA